MPLTPGGCGSCCNCSRGADANTVQIATDAIQFVGAASAANGAIRRLKPPYSLDK